MRIKINDLQREALEYHSGLVPYLDNMTKTYIEVGEHPTSNPQAFEQALTRTINDIKDQNRRLGLRASTGTIALQSVR